MLPYIVPCVSAEAFSAVLQTFAQEAQAGPRRQLVVVLDGAGWHVAKDLRVPEHVHLVFLPPYSPELQPAERIWPLVNEAIANRGFADMTALDRRIDERCNQILDDPDTLKALTNYHWWPKDVYADDAPMA